MLFTFKLKMVRILFQIDQLLHRQSAVEEQLRTAKKLVFATLLMMIIILIFLVMATNSMTSSLLSAAVHNSNVIRGTSDEGHHEL